MLKNISIKARLIFVIVLLGAELVVGAALGLVNLARANADLHALYANRLVCLGQLDQIVRKLNINQLNLMEAVTAEQGRLPELLAKIEANDGIIERVWKDYTATLSSAGEQAAAARFLQARARFAQDVLQPAVAALGGGDVATATAIAHGSMRTRFVPVREQIDALIKLQLDEAEKAQQRAQSRYALVSAVCLSGMAGGLVLAGVFGAMLVRGIVRPIEKAVDIAAAVANGDLTQDIAARSGDETGRLMGALHAMNQGLASIVGRVRAGTDTIATASSQIAAGNLDLSTRTEQQAAALEETASSMEQLTATVRQNADNARQANTLAQSASTVASRGGAVMTEVVTTMGDINASSARIADIIGVIDGIAFQTNILALNAAVEAARAGEQGRGFAVVASEVRGLAQRSAAAAREIKSLIDDSVRSVGHGAALVDRAGATMAEIVRSIDSVTDIMAEITSASQEQTAGIEQVSRAIVQMDQATQQNAALVEQASAAAQSLREEAGELARTVGTFHLRAQDAAGTPRRHDAVGWTASPSTRSTIA